MAIHYACCFVMASCLLYSFFLPSSLVIQASKLESPRLLSFQLHLQLTLSKQINLQHNTTQPFSPYLFSNQPLFRFDQSSRALISVGSASGLYLARPAASTDPCYLFVTASLQNYQGAGHIASIKGGENDGDEGSLVLMGSLPSGAISVIGGTRAFAFANGQATVSIADGESEQLIISLDVELEHESEDATF